MNLSYCEVCGVLIQAGEGPAKLPEGVICAACFESRRVVTTQQADQLAGGLVQFDCCYCHSLLRLKAVSKRTRVRCPKCNDAFYLHEDGRIEARLEGSKTAVLQQDDVAPLGKPERAGDKTQPIKRSEALGLDRQHAMLEELKPKGLDFIDALPQRKGEVALDTGKYRRPVPADATPALRASDEGHVDLGAGELRRKAEAITPPPEPEPDEPVTPTASEPRPPTPKPAAPRRPAAKPRRGGRLLWACVVLPVILGVGLAVAAQQRLPFTFQGTFGKRLHDLGQRVSGGVRSLDSVLPPGARMALPRRAEVAPVGSR